MHGYHQRENVRLQNQRLEIVIMKDVLIPLGMLLFIVLFAYALIHTARKQKKSKAGVFKAFADRFGLRYRQEDDGTAQGFAKDFDGIGRFFSPSQGKVIPKDVVAGVIEGASVVLFRHSIRFGQGWAREWYVAGVTGAEVVAERCAVQFCNKRSDKTTMILQDPVVKEKKAGPYSLVVRAPDSAAAGSVADDTVLEQLAGLAENLSFRPELQIRGRRIAAYLADRNASVELETLKSLLDFARGSAGLLGRSECLERRPQDGSLE